MKSILLVSMVALCLEATAFARCPVGGSEHSVGDGPGSGTNLALERFEQSNEIAGTRDLVRRHGYCPVSYGPQVRLLDQTCNAQGCSATYAIDMFYQHPTTGDARTVSGRLRTMAGSGGPSARGYFSADAFSLDGLGTETALDEEQSDLVMNAMQAAGIRQDQILMGASTLVAGRLQCNRIVVPNAVAHCTWTAGYQQLPVADAAVADSLHETLSQLGAYQLPVLMGNSRTSAALVRCSRVVYPGAKASCSIVIEE